MDEDAAYAAAADALTDRDMAAYEAIKASMPGLDWSGHDRRAALIAGKTFEDIGIDPLWQRLGYQASPKRVLGGKDDDSVRI